jgi:hypothetical protein
MRSMRGAVQGRETPVKGIISKGRFVQGPQHTRTFGRGHIGRGHINLASKKGKLGQLIGILGQRKEDVRQGRDHVRQGKEDGR